MRAAPDALPNGFQAPRVTEIDGIRGWASLCVVAYHVIWQIFGVTAPGLRNVGTAFVLDGPLAVALFFVLSGDALSSAVLNSTKVFNLGQLMLKRYVRLVLPIGAASLVIFDVRANNLVCNSAAAAIVHQTGYFGSWLARVPSLLGIADYTLRGVFFGATAPTIDRFLWTIPVEMSASFFIFVALAIAKFTRRPQVVAGFAFLVCIGVDQLYYTSCFFAGMCFAAFRSSGGFERLQARRPAAFLSGGLIALLVTADTVLHLAENHAATPLFADALVFCTLCNAPLCRAFASRVSLFLGKISFSLYLVQFPILISATSFAIIAADRHGGLDGLRIALIASGSIALCMLAAVMFEPIDRLSIAASRRVSRVNFMALTSGLGGRMPLQSRRTPVPAEAEVVLPGRCLPGR